MPACLPSAAPFPAAVACSQLMSWPHSSPSPVTGAGTNYTAAALWGAPKLPLGGLWRPWARIERGSATSVVVARHQVLIDANFHTGG